MEAATFIAKPLLARAKGAEIFGSLWYLLAVEVEDNSSGWACVGQGVRTKMTWLRRHGFELALPPATERSK